MTAVAELEAGDDLGAWHEAHKGTHLLHWEVSTVRPLDRPEQTIAFHTATDEQVGKVRLGRAIGLSATILAAVAFPSHLALTSLFPGW